MNIQTMVDVWNDRAGTLGVKFQSGKKVDELPEQVLTGIEYACPICKKLHDSELQAIKCRDQRYDTAGLQVGDILIIPGAVFYTPPVAGHKRWSAFHIPASPEAQNNFDNEGQWFPYYVVSAVHPDKNYQHRCVVTVVTLHNGELYGGWNPATGDGHHALFHPGRKRVDQHSDHGSTWWTTKRHGTTFGSRILAAEPSSALLADAAKIATLGISTEKLL